MCFCIRKVCFYHWLLVILYWITWSTISIGTQFSPATSLEPPWYQTLHILFHLQCQTFPGKVSLTRLPYHLSEPITACAVKANSERQLTRRHLQLGQGDRVHENRIKLPWPPIPLHASFMRAISTCHYRPSNSTHCDFDLSCTPRKRNLILMSLFSKDIGLSFAFPS